MMDLATDSEVFLRTAQVGERVKITTKKENSYYNGEIKLASENKILIVDIKGKPIMIDLSDILIMINQDVRE